MPGHDLLRHEQVLVKVLRGEHGGLGGSVDDGHTQVANLVGLCEIPQFPGCAREGRIGGTHVLLAVVSRVYVDMTVV